jgi:tRNA(fMet)-specific endonuclease VapC
MNRLCLDTSAYSQFKRGHPPVVELLDRADWIGIPTIVIGELLLGFLLGGRNTENKCELGVFLDEPIVEELPVERQVGEIYAEIVAELRRNGTPVPSNDVWIAATASRADATVLTYDTHFSAIRRVGSILLRA